MRETRGAALIRRARSTIAARVALSRRARQALSRLGFPGGSGTAAFREATYVRHNQRRLEHLASLDLPVCGRTVLEVGAGIGDHSSFFLDRKCILTTTDAREGNLRVLRRRFPSLEVAHLDLEQPFGFEDRRFEVVYCYGTLYHLRTPELALQFMADRCTGQLLLETCVSMGTDDAVNLTPESKRVASQAVSGLGCRPTRTWVFRRLSRLFPYVYATRTQPAHEEFPLDWSSHHRTDRLTRAVFIASREPLDSRWLSDSLPMRQSLCGGAAGDLGPATRDSAEEARRSD